jgi:hypothetical protein
LIRAFFGGYAEVPQSAGVIHMLKEPSKIKGLSTSVAETDVGGLQNLLWKASDDSNPLSPAVLDLNALTADPLLPFLVPVIPAHSLYRSLENHGLEEAVEVVEWLRGHQLHQVLDFDIWTFDNTLASPVVAPDKVLTWFRVWLELGAEFAADRIFELEEDLVVTLFAQLFEILPEGIAISADNVTDDYHTTPDKRFYLKFKSESNPETWEILQETIRAMYGKDANQASKTFAYAAMLITQESLENEVRWRKGRMADQGFVELSEALQFLKPRKQEELVANNVQHLKLEAAAAQDELVRKQKYAKTQSAFMAEIDPEIFDGIVETMRSMEPEMAGGYVRSLLSAGEIARLTGSSQSANEDLLEDGDILLESVEKAVAMCRAKLGSFAARPFQQMVEKGKSESEMLLIERAFAVFAEEDSELVLDLKARIARLGNTLATGLAPTENLSPEIFGRTMEVLRGALNIGLQLSVLKPTEWGLNPLAEADFEEMCAADRLRNLGPERLFQMGWWHVNQLPQKLLRNLQSLVEAEPLRFSHLNPVVKVRLDDGSVLETKVSKLWESGRMGDVRRWLHSVEETLPAPTFWVWNALLNRAPFFPEAFESSSRTLRAFTTVSEVVVVDHFLENMRTNLNDETHSQSEMSKERGR